MNVNKTAHAAWCGAAALVICSGTCVGAAVDGETFRTSNGEDWFQTSNYSSLERGPWKRGKVPSDGGTAYFVTPGTIKLAPTAGLQLGAIEVRSGATANLFTRGLTMVGDNPYIQAAYNSVFQIDSTMPLSGTGANTFTLKSAPGPGRLRVART